MWFSESVKAPDLRKGESMAQEWAGKGESMAQEWAGKSESMAQEWAGIPALRKACAAS